MSQIPLYPSEALVPSFVLEQRAFTAYIRNPGERAPPNGVDPGRMAVYRDLFYHNVEALLAGNFPVLRGVLGEERWHVLMQDYFARHRARTPLFPYMPQEFLDYLQNERGEHADDLPFMAELAHYEWVETALTIAEAEIDWDRVGSVDLSEGDLLQGVPILSPLAWPLAYRFPVHRIGPDFQPQGPEEQPTYLVVYRDRHDRVGFLEVNPVTARLLALILQGQGCSGRQLLEQIALELRHPEPEVVIAGGMEILRGLQDKDILLGTF
jgi:hypothetical protein